MNSVIAFRALNQRPQTRIMAQPSEGGFRYTVFPDDSRPAGILPADSLADARGMAAFFSDTAIEMGPAAAFGRSEA